MVQEWFFWETRQKVLVHGRLEGRDLVMEELLARQQPNYYVKRRLIGSLLELCVVSRREICVYQPLQRAKAARCISGLRVGPLANRRPSILLTTNG